MIIGLVRGFILAFALIVIAAGCGPGQDTPKPKEPERIVDNKNDGAYPDKTGTIVGRIVFKGTPPALNKVKVNKDSEVCGEYQHSEELVVNPENKGVRWAVVSVGKLKRVVPDDRIYEGRELVLDQKGCRFQPHVSVMEVYDKINILNSDGILHNIHSFPLSRFNQPFNEAQPKFKKQITKTFRAPDQVKIKCDAHSWMEGWIVVVQNPYYDVTGASGEFRIENVPVGRQKLEMWHEKLGSALTEVVVEEGKETRISDFEWSIVSVQPTSDKSVKKRGTTVAKPIFDEKCAACHGASGKGDGPAASALAHKPADLTAKATQDKSDAGLEKLISDGKPDKGMPPWNSLSAKDIKNLVDYIRYLGGQ